MKSPFKFLAACFAALCVTVAAFAAEASPAGTWKWTVQGRQGGQGFEQTLKLDYKDGKLTGTMQGVQSGQPLVVTIFVLTLGSYVALIGFTIHWLREDVRLSRDAEHANSGDPWHRT